MHLIIHSTAVHLCVLYFSQCVGSHVSETPVSIASVHIIEPFEGGGGGGGGGGARYTTVITVIQGHMAYHLEGVLSPRRHLRPETLHDFMK